MLKGLCPLCLTLRCHIQQDSSNQASFCVPLEQTLSIHEILEYFEGLFVAIQEKLMLDSNYLQTILKV